MPATEIILRAEDCVKGMRSLPAESVDLVVTSPPYNLGIKYGRYKDKLNGEEYLSWSLQWAAEVNRVLKSSGSFFLNVGASPSNPLLPHQLVVALGRQFVLQNTFHWIKSITVDTRAGEQISVGHFKPINSRRFVTDCHEFVFHLTKDGETVLDRLGMGVAYSDKSNIARWGHTKGKDLRCRGNNWFIPYETINFRSRDRPHPATFPTQLAVNCLRIHGLKPELVMLDPFVGIGHSALAAKECGIRQFIGFDIDPEYLEEARAAVTPGALPAEAAPLKSKRGRPRRKPAALEPSLFDLEPQ